MNGTRQILIESKYSLIIRFKIIFCANVVHEFSTFKKIYRVNLLKKYSENVFIWVLWGTELFHQKCMNNV